jgi:hypothetical protein
VIQALAQEVRGSESAFVIDDPDDVTKPEIERVRYEIEVSIEGETEEDEPDEDEDENEVEEN